MGQVIYMDVGAQGLDMIRPLWEGLIAHIKVRSTYFSQWFEARTFEQRKNEILKKSVAGKLRVDLAVDEGRCIGYCVSSISDRIGEVDSIFVEEGHRSRGIGGEMMKRALAWMESEKAGSVKISASVGNEEVLPFYQRHGFFPRYILLEKVR